MQTNNLRKLIIGKMCVALKPLGFKHDGATFFREVGGVIQVINLQADRWNSSEEAKYYVNLAAYNQRANDLWNGNDTHGNPKEYYGQIRKRVRRDNCSDQWIFNANDNIEPKIDELVATTTNQAKLYFNDINTVNSLVGFILDNDKDSINTPMSGYLYKSILFFIAGDALKSQAAFDKVVKITNSDVKNQKTLKSQQRRLMEIAKRININTDFPDLNGEICVNIRIPIASAAMSKIESRVQMKVLGYLDKIERSDVGYVSLYGMFAEEKVCILKFYTKDPELVMAHIKDKAGKLQLTLQIMTSQ